MIEENVETFIVPNGKLGSLKGGLLFLDDFRAPLAKEEVSGLAIEHAQSVLSRRRRGFLVGIAVLPRKLYSTVLGCLFQMILAVLGLDTSSATLTWHLLRTSQSGTTYCSFLVL